MSEAMSAWAARATGIDAVMAIAPAAIRNSRRLVMVPPFRSEVTHGVAARINPDIARNAAAADKGGSARELQ